MAAFENLGVMPEISKVVTEMGWNLPTDIQVESIPLILGGGDVLMAAETGSGKTAAFSIPVIQIVHESYASKGNSAKIQSAGPTFTKWQMNPFDRGSSFAIASDGLLCQCREFKDWHGCRSSKGVTSGKYYYEALCKDEGLNRVGWSTSTADLNLGTDKQGYGFGGTGKKSNNRQFDTYGEPFTMHDTVGCYLDMDAGKIKYSKNGVDLGHAFDIPAHLRKQAMYAACVLKNAEIQYNFGAEAFKYPPSDGYVALAKAPVNCSVNSSATGGKSLAKQSRKDPNSPYAIIIEPSRELAEQTANIIKLLKKNISKPELFEVLVVGGVPASDQLKQIERGVDILIGTPGRIDDFISTRKIDLNQVRFLVLDECDGLLSAGNGDFIKRMHTRIPQTSSDGRRLQVIVCSATLHSFDVKKLAEKIMHFPIWVDLKGEDSVPDTVHHVVVPIDPVSDPSWMGLRKHVNTDGVHKQDYIKKDSKGKWSEGVKILKGEYCVRAIHEHNMDQSIIFCRTKLDCDNMEQYFKDMGGGPNHPSHPLSCVCLHSDRKPPERRSNLERFKKAEVRHLICTDVAARGIDVRGVPFVINVTLPDDKQNYVHRIGRVGRAERMGLAISLVATKHNEKVWYHSNCNTRGRGCYNTELTDRGGCCIWYNEGRLLGDIEDHLKITIEQTTPKMEIPVNEFDGKVVYGSKKSATGGGTYKGHVDDLAPTVDELQDLEKSAQTSFLNMKNLTFLSAKS
uniref:ATP-dependent RNA helicase n=1 Tax=Phallusia mammillata TaxID=59560 RepID=A0A6F9DA34_9ASCI|nr:ATP-dependent RNA helicase DDX1-like [Phallusia mammillata]